MPASPPPPFDNAPWENPDLTIPAEALRVQTMLSDEESRLLYWLARDYATGEGVICDLGCFAGGSTARLLAGVEDAGRDTAVHAFDHFTIQDEMKQRYLYDSGIGPFRGTNMLPAVTQLLAPWIDQIRFHRGDIRRVRWPGEPIELLFVDAAKTPVSADYIAGMFMTALIPGRSLVIQQDYLHWRQPWVSAQMELLAECFEPVAWCRKGTVVFRCTAPLTPEILSRSRTEGLSDRSMIKLIRQAILRFPKRPQRARLAAALMAIQDNPGERLPYKMSNDGFNSDRLQALLDGIAAEQAG